MVNYSGEKIYSNRVCASVQAGNLGEIFYSFYPLLPITKY